MIAITTADIKETFTPSYYLRGLEYYTRRKVKGFRITTSKLLDSDDYAKLTAKVQGSGGQTYEQVIDVYKDFGEIIIEGECSCPVEYNCKHVAAVCIAYQKDYLSKYLPDGSKVLDEIGMVGDTAVELWLKGLYP